MALLYTAGKWAVNAAVVDYCAMFRALRVVVPEPRPITHILNFSPRIWLPLVPSSWPRYAAMPPHRAVYKRCRLDEIALARYDTGGVSL